MRTSIVQRSTPALVSVLLGAAAITYVACQSATVDNSGIDDAGGPVDPNADFAQSSSDLAGIQPADLAGNKSDLSGTMADLASGGPPEGDPLLNGITAEHNKARAAVSPVPAVALPALTWNTTVAATAQGWANRCMFMHNPSTPYGENIYATTGSTTPAAVVTSWVSEKANYNYSANSCSATCGHYTQVVWRNSLRLGCGVKNCTTGSPFGGGAWQFWVCNYDPPGNISGQRPY